MKIKLLFTFVFWFLFAGYMRAQDTTRPVMTQSAYDSILKALKHTAEPKQTDTAQPAENKMPAIINGSKSNNAPNTELIAPPAKTDTARMHHVGDSIIRQTRIKHRDSLIMVRNIALEEKEKPKYAFTGYLALMGGEGFPQGSFQSVSFPNSGGVFSLTAAFPGIISHFGVIFKFDYGFNGLDKQRYMDSLKHWVGDYNISYSMGNNSYYYTYTTYMMGVYYTYPLSNKFCIDARILIGGMSASIPGFTVSAYDYLSQHTLAINSYAASGFAFAYNEGLSLRYLPTPRVSVLLGIDNVSSRPFFTITNNSLAADAKGFAYQTATQNTTVNQPFHVFSLSVGVGYTIVTKAK